MKTLFPIDHINKRAAALLVCLVFAFSFMLPLAAGAERSGRTVRVGWFESPFNSMDGLGRRSGYAYEFQQKIAAYTGWNYEYVEGSWPELLQMLINGEIDLMSDVSYTPERAELMLYSDMEMGSEDYYIFVSPDDQRIRLDDPRTLNGMRIGVNRGSVQIGFFREWAEQYGVQAELVETTGLDQESMQMVLSGELDANISLDSYGGTESTIPVFKVGSSEFYFAVSRNRPELLEELNSAMNSIQAENRYFIQQLSQKYFGATGANLFLGMAEKNWLAERGGVIRVGYQDDFLAFCAEDKKTGELTGALKDYLDRAAVCFSNAEISYEAVAYPNVNAAMDALKNREVDCVFPSILSTADGESRGLVMTPAMMSTDIVAVVRKADRDTVLSKEHVAAAITENDPNFEAVIRDHFPMWESKRYEDIRTCLKAVDEGKADCVLISSYQYNSLAKLCEQYDLVELATGEVADLFFAVNLGDNALYSILTRTTNLVSDASTYAALSYYSSDSSKVTLGAFIRHNLLLVCAVAVSVAALIIIVVIQHSLIVTRREAAETKNKVQNLNEQVFVDALTRVKNKAAYAQWSERINESIQKGEQEPFAVAVCDVNNLKDVNDLFGHKEGDACIKKACARICAVFSHSPVFRVGGDEFVVILSGADFARRKELLEQISAVPRERSAVRMGDTIAAGMAEYDKERHTSLLSVFEEADKAMYERKRAMKETILQAPEKSAEENDNDTEADPVIASRKLILIADDIEVNREIMGDYLKEEYDVLFASDGVETLNVLRANKDEVDLVLLDLQMPNMDGREVIAEMQVDEELMDIPVVFLTVDQAAELDCLKIGAMDFIPKPFPDIEIVKARIDKCIELAEDRELIRHTEHDKLTGLLNRDYFYRYVPRFDLLHRGAALDAVVCDVNRFHALNKQYGRRTGDAVLRAVGAGVKKLARKTGGLSCREGGDTFLIYCPHREDWEQLIGELLNELKAQKDIADKAGVRFGVFADAQTEEDITERFDRARVAAERVKDDPTKVCGYYDRE